MAGNTGSSTKKDPMVEFVVSEMERYEKNLSDRFQEAADIYDQWRNEPPKRSYDWQNAVHVPMTFEAEQTITPRIFSALFPEDAPVEIITYNAPPEQGVSIKSAIQHHFRQSNVQGKVMMPLSQCTLLGTGYLYSPWLYRTKWQKDRQGERYEAIVDNRPDCESVSFFEIFPHPAKLSMDDGLPLIRRRFCDAEYLKRLAEMPQFKFQNLSEALKSDSVVKRGSKILGSDGKPMDLKKREEYELLEFWGPWDTQYKDEKGDIKTRKAVPHWITIVNRSVKVRSSENPYNHQRPPFCKFTLYEDINPCWFGIGIGKVGKPTQERLNKIVNQRLDNVDLVMNKQGFYNGMDTLINVKKLQVSKPGQWHKVSDTVNSIKWMDIPDVTSSSYKEEEIAKQDYRESTGATVPLMPTDEGQHRTASGMNLLQGAAGMRFRPILRKMEKDLIQDLAGMYLSNLQQFMVLPEWIQIMTDDGNEQAVKLTPEMIQGKAHFIPTGLSEMMNKEMQIGQLLRFREITANDPTINRALINKKIGQLMGFKDLKDIIIKQQPAQMGQGQLDPSTQEKVRQRLAEGASPEQIKLEILGQPPAPDQQPAGAAA